MTRPPYVAVVTGSSSGIGAAIAIRFAETIATHVVVHGRENIQGANQTASAVRERGAAAETIMGDLADVDSDHRLLSLPWQINGRVDAWVHCAGADVLTDASDISFDEKLLHLLEVDVFQTTRLARHVAQRLNSQPSWQDQTNQRSARQPSMVFIGWDQATEGMEGDAGQMFGPTKAAVMALSKSMAQQHAPNIRVNCVAPGWIRTAWGENVASDYWDRRAKGNALMQRWGHPDDIADAVIFLCGPGGGFVTGETLNVNGGWNRNWIDPTET